MDRFNLYFVTFFGIGNIRFAEIVTSSSVTCLIFYFSISYSPQSFWLLLVIFLLALFYTPYAISKSLEHFDNNNPKQIVINKVLGISIPLFILSLAFHEKILSDFLNSLISTIWFLDKSITITKFYAIFYYKYLIFANFLLFRFFCIFKPFSISYADKKKIFLGLVFNDILAGLYCVLFPIVLMSLKLLLRSMVF